MTDDLRPLLVDLREYSLQSLLMDVLAHSVSGYLDVIHLARAANVKTGTLVTMMDELERQGQIRWWIDRESGAVGWEILK
jgi:DNA-binding MarR family transcriptional regulator